MTPELQKQLADMLAKLTEATEKGATWAAGQIPPLVQDKIVFGRVDESFQLAFCLATIGGLVLLIRFCYGRIDKADDPVGWAIGMIFTGLGCLVMAFVFAEQFHVTLMVWFAPRLYIVEWLKGMVTK